MKTTDFDNFLKENNMDVEYVTTPLDFAGITDKTITINEKCHETRLADYSKATSEAAYDYIQKYNLYKLFGMKDENKTTETTLDSAPFNIKGRYNNRELHNKTHFFDYDYPNNDFIKQMIDNDIHESPKTELMTKETAGLGIYSKIKDRFKNIHSKKLELNNNFHSTTDVVITDLYFDDSEEPLQGEDVKNNNKTSSVPIVKLKNGEERKKSDHNDTIKTIHKTTSDLHNNESKTKENKTTKQSVTKIDKIHPKPSSKNPRRCAFNIKHNYLLYNMSDYNSEINKLAPTSTVNYDVVFGVVSTDAHNTNRGK